MDGTLDPATDNAVLFATSSNGMILQQITDPLSATALTTPGNDSCVTLASAGTDYSFRGVALDPSLPVCPYTGDPTGTEPG